MIMVHRTVRRKPTNRSALPQHNAPGDVVLPVGLRVGEQTFDRPPRTGVARAPDEAVRVVGLGRVEHRPPRARTAVTEERDLRLTREVRPVRLAAAVHQRDQTVVVVQRVVRLPRVVNDAAMIGGGGGRQ